jgi:uncharacterized RDD family membrane protein YckC
MAEWWRRLVAFGIDMLILGVPWAIIVSVVTSPSSTVNSSPTSTASFTTGTWISLGVGFIVVLGYFAFLDGSPRGQTLGKRALSIAVRDLRSGGTIGAGKALGRRFFFFALYFAFVIPFFLNGLWPLWDPLRQAWHDKISTSCVIQVS